MLAFQCNSEHREQLQVSRVTSESTVGTDPTGHSLGGLPNISGAPNQKLWKHSKTSIPTQAHHLVICARQATKKESPMPSALGRLMGRKRTRRLRSPPRAWPRRAGQGRGGKQARLWQEPGPNFASVTPVPLKAVGMGQCFWARPLSPLSAARQPCYLHPRAKQALDGMVGGTIVGEGLFLSSWHRSKAQVCMGEKGRGHSRKVIMDFWVWSSPSTWEPADSNSSNQSLAARKCPLSQSSLQIINIYL